MAENTPGDGYTSPFGNGDGATTEQGPSTGAHDFITDPTSNDTVPGRDFTKDVFVQKRGDGCNPDTVPSGGRYPYEGPAQVPANKPFKLTGG